MRIRRPIKTRAENEHSRYLMGIIDQISAAGYVSVMLHLMALEMHITYDVQEDGKPYEGKFYDYAATAANSIRHKGILTVEDMLALDEWIVQQQLIGEASRHVNV